MSEKVWIEKFRPRKLNEVIGQRHITKRLRKLVENINDGKSTLPHFLFSGDPGTGKTTVAQALIRELYGDNFRMLELNASDDRGIDTVRETIKSYCRTSTVDGNLNIIFLDEADGLTPQAQEALRRTMEKYSTNTRFILSCNYSNKVIDALRSRCAILNFFPLTDKNMRKLIKQISEKEGIYLTPDAVGTLAFVSKGDARTCLNALHYLSGSQEGEIKEKDIYDYAWRIDVHEVTALLKLCIIVKDVKDVSVRMDEIDDKMLEFYRRGYTNQNIVDGMYLSIKGLKVKQRVKAKLIYDLGMLDYRITSGCNPTIQVRAYFYGIFLNKIKKVKK